MHSDKSPAEYRSILERRIDTFRLSREKVKKEIVELKAGTGMGKEVRELEGQVKWWSGIIEGEERELKALS